MKIALLLSYDGTDFHGFARQRAARTVQGELERCLSMLLRTDVSTTGAGRTDAGVHAAGQVVSFVAPEHADPAWLARRLNKLLAPEISIRVAARAGDDFDARFSAVRREYEYRAYAGVAPDPFRDRFSTFVPGELKLARMRAGARVLIGEHDFSAFCRRGDGSMVRRVRSVSIARAGDETTFAVKADSFCHQMVRSVVGLLLDVGAGKREPGDIARALASRDRALAGPVAPARGLTLTRVVYRPDPFGNS